MRPDPIRAKHADVDHIRRQIKQDNSRDAEYQSTRQVLARLFDLACDKRRSLPATVSEYDRHERSAKGCQQIG